MQPVDYLVSIGHRGAEKPQLLPILIQLVEQFLRRGVCVLCTSIQVALTNQFRIVHTASFRRETVRTRQK